MKILHCLSLLLFFPCEAALENYYKRLDNPERSSSFRNIDNIYLINLDQRAEKLANCQRELNPHGIYPQRFPAIYGWTLPPKVIQDIGLTFLPGMWRGREPVFFFPPDGDGSPVFINLSDDWFGFSFLSNWTSLGAVGCTLSHLSVLQDGYDAGFSTIWIMEDDVVVRSDPHQLSALIDKLDALVGEEGWDILYTDYDALINIDKDKDLLQQLPMMWRPDIPFFDLRSLIVYSDLGDDFVNIGSRYRAHSYIVRRSGMEKILEFYQDHNIFVPYDHEIFFIPNLRVFTLKYQVVTSQEVGSDTKFKFFKN